MIPLVEELVVEGERLARSATYIGLCLYRKDLLHCSTLLHSLNFASS